MNALAPAANVHSLQPVRAGSAHVLRRSREAPCPVRRLNTELGLHLRPAGVILIRLNAVLMQASRNLPARLSHRFGSRIEVESGPTVRSGGKTNCPALVGSLAVRNARPNPSLELTRYGRRRLAAPGRRWHCPSAASRPLPQRAAQLERYASAPEASGVSAVARCAGASRCGPWAESAASRSASAWSSAEPRAGHVVLFGFVLSAWGRARAAARREAQPALRRAPPPLCRSSGALRVRTRVPLGSGSHNLAFERTAFGGRSLPLQGLPPLSSQRSLSSRAAARITSDLA
jgi:hypothetical protein